MALFSFASRAPLIPLFLTLASVGCAASRTVGDEDGSVSSLDGSISSRDASAGRDGSTARDGSVTFVDGSTARDGSVPPGDGGWVPGPDGGWVPGPDAGFTRDWVELCSSACRHAVGCGALGLDSVTECTRNCLGGETTFGTPGCRDLAYQAVQCLEALPCADLAGLQPDETFCAPYFARLDRMCGGG